jgi:uncharacterized protein YkwD
MRSPATSLLALLLVLGLVAALEVAPAGGADRRVVRVLAANRVEAPARERLNAVRREHGLRPLAFSAQLARAARVHAVSMGRRGYFSHSSADGSSLARRLARYYRPSAQHLVVGETLYWRSPHASPGDVVTRWLQSPEHRHILLDPEWRDFALEAVYVPAAPGVFGGRPVTIVVADFGALRP